MRTDPRISAALVGLGMDPFVAERLAESVGVEAGDSPATIANKAEAFKARSSALLFQQPKAPGGGQSDDRPQPKRLDDVVRDMRDGKHGPEMARMMQARCPDPDA